MPVARSSNLEGMWSQQVMPVVRSSGKTKVFACSGIKGFPFPFARSCPGRCKSLPLGPLELLGL